MGIVIGLILGVERYMRVIVPCIMIPRIIHYFYRIYKNRLWRRATDFKEYSGTWGIVIGASRGYGKYYSLALGKRGMNVCLVDKDKEEMIKIAREIETENGGGVKTKIVVADLLESNVYKEIIEPEIIEDIVVNKKERIGMLINSGEEPFRPPRKKFLEYSMKEEEEMTSLYVKSTSRMIRMVLPILINQNFGRILNLSSLSSYFPQYNIPYSSCMARINSITESLCIEYPTRKERNNVVIKGHLVGTKLLPGYWGGPDINVEPEIFAENSINCFDMYPHMSLVVPYFPHAFQWWVLSLMPVFLKNYFLNKIVKLNNILN